MRIGIFGGSFNPPHMMHEEIARKLLGHYVDKIIFVPTGMKYEYKNNLISNENRIAMLEKMISSLDSCSISTYELKDEVVYTYQSLDYFKEKYPNDEVYFICGTDNLSYIDQWKRGDYLLSNHQFLIILRDTNPIDELLEKYKDYRDHFIITDVVARDVSSSFIRKCIQQKQLDSIKDLLHPDVFSYILENHLYEEEK